MSEIMTGAEVKNTINRLIEAANRRDESPVNLFAWEIIQLMTRSGAMMKLAPDGELLDLENVDLTDH